MVLKTLRTSNLYVVNDATIDGDLDVNGNFTFGDATTDTLTATGSITMQADNLVSSNKKIKFRDDAIYIQSADDGHLDLTADTSIDLNGNTVIGGALTLARQSVATNSNINTNAVIVGVDSSTYAITVTLQSSSVANGKIYIINDEGGNAGANNITIATEGSETIDGNATATISSNHGTLRVYSDGTNWFTF